MPVLKVNEFPDGSGNLTSDDVFLFVDDPTSSGVTKKISLSNLIDTIGVVTVSGSGAPFNVTTVDLHNGGVQNAQVLQFTDTDYQSVITGPTPASGINAQRIIIQGQRAQGNAEGGDVYLWGGDANANGGDIKIYAGDADNNESPGYGGYINIDAGNGFDSGGTLSLSAGASTNAGGHVYITAGYAQSGQAGSVEIGGGSTSGGMPGPVIVRTNNNTHTWTFNSSGDLEVPGNIQLNNGTTLAVGTFDNSTGGNNGISLNCYVGYELNWQGGHLKSTQDGGLTAAHIWCDSSIEFPGSNVDNMEINSSGLIFPDGSVQTTAPNDKCYGSFYDTTTQTNPSVSGVNTMVFNTVDLSHNISMVDNSKLTFHRTSTYNIQFSAQLDKTDGGDDEVDIWISKNNTDVEWTNTRISMHQQDAKTVAAWNFMVSANSGDYIEFKWYSADPNMRILAQSGLINPTRPNIPSIILTANEI